MKKLFFIYIYIIVFSVGAFAQPQNSLVKDITLPTPNAASLGKFGDIPVSYYTGVPNISVPIYSAQEGPLSLPISLNYHSSGIRVAETASWVGMGWNLSAGGMVSRTIRGIADEGGGGYLSQADNLVDPLGTSNGATRTQQFFDATSGQLDTEPDLFNFSFPGGSGKFLIQKDTGIFFMPASDLKVSFDQSSTNNDIIRFTITTTDGTQYVFGKLDSDPISNPYMGMDRIEFDNVQSGQLVPTTWHLRKVISADNNYEITLDYIKEQYRYRSLSSNTYQFAPQLVGGNPATVSGVSIGTNTAAVNHNVEGYRLSQISTSTCTIDFIATNQRQDLDHYFGNTSTPKAKRLDIIRVSSGNSNDEEFCTEYALNYDYMDASVCSQASGMSYTAGELKRLRLLSVQQSSCASVSPSITIPPYTFAYNSGQLPPRLSKATDHWGYYNGACSNEGTLNIPENEDAFWGGAQPVSVPAFTADRESSESHMLIGVLNKITYPTGGSTSFTLEGNRVKDVLATTTQTTILPEMSNCTYPGQPAPGGGFQCCSDTPVLVTDNFTSSEVTNVKYRLALYDNRDICLPSVAPAVWLKITDNNLSAPNNSWTRSFTFGGGISCLNDYCYEEDDITNIIPGGLTAGHSYTFELISSNGNGKVTFRMFQETTNNIQTVEKVVGGLRIQQMVINDGDANTSNNIIKDFEYGTSDSDTLSSGHLYQEPKYFGYQYCMPADTNLCGGIYADRWGLKFFANSIAPLSNVNGYHIGYRRVVESSPGNGRTILNYNPEVLIPNQPSAQPDGYPYAPDLARVRDGQNILTSIHEEGQTNALSQSIPAYLSESYTNLTNHTIYKVEKFTVPDNANQTNIDYFYAVPYSPRTAPFRLESMTKVNDGVSVTTSYEYDNQGNHLFPTSTTTTNSDNVVYKTEYDYAFDVGGAVMQDLVDRNIIAQPIETRVYADNQQISGSRTNYGFYYADGTRTGTGSGDPFPYPYQFEDYKANADGTGGRWETEGEFQTYWADNLAGKSGYPKQFLMTDWGEVETYDWENGLIKQRTYKDFIWNYEYYQDSRLVKKITDIDGQPVFYKFDPLMRLDKVLARPKIALPNINVDNDFNVVTTYDYGYGGTQFPSVMNSVHTSTTFTSVTNSNYTTEELFNYMDGLGRAVQVVDKQHAQSGNDVINHTFYDNQGRPYRVYEPFEAQQTSGAFLPDAAWPQGSEYYTEATYEASPLNRKASVIPPDWHATTFDYGSNASVISINGVSYGANTLMVQTTTDPDNKQAITYTDIRGRQLLSTQKGTGAGEEAKTQYQYDKKDRLLQVTPPDVSYGNILLSYLYQYDEEDRMISKDLPDQGMITYAYDNRDLVIAMQDANMRAMGRTLITEYDNYGRETRTGFQNTSFNFANPGSSTMDEILTTTTYDGLNQGTNPPAIYNGKMSKTQTKILGTSNWLVNETEYDDFGRISRTLGNHHLNLNNAQADITVFQYDFADNPVNQLRTHIVGGVTTTIEDKMHYDASGRLSKTFHDVTGLSEVQTSEITYTAKDQIDHRRIGKTATSFLQDVGE
ncbi:MAG: DUF6443 domain-containing protein [Bacteroidota bacterium]